MSTSDFQIAVLTKLSELIKSLDIETALIAPTANAPFYSLLARFVKMGKNEKTLQLEFTFLPLEPSVAAQGVYLLQAFIQLDDALEPSKINDLLSLIARLNFYLPIGAFGVGDDQKVLYYKHNCMLTQDFSIDVAVGLIDKQTGLILHQMNLFYDALLNVATGRQTVDEALQANAALASFLKS